MSTTPAFYPIGTPGVAWGAAERAQWLSRQRRLRSHADDVVQAIERLRGGWDVVEYGSVEYPPEAYPLLAPAADWVEHQFDVPDTVNAITSWVTGSVASLARESLVQLIGMVLTLYMLFYFLRDRRGILGRAHAQLFVIGHESAYAATLSVEAAWISSIAVPSERSNSSSLT